MSQHDALQSRIARLDKAVIGQRRFLGRIPDPDTRDRAERHLLTLVDMRDEVAARLAETQRPLAAAG